MPSPFPGMNPYLEQEHAWRDFHERFVPAAAELLSPQVSPAYIVKIEAHLYIHERSAEERRLLGFGDVGIARVQALPQPGDGVGLLSAPARVLLPAVDIEEESYLEIRDRLSRQLITVIELLSPSNKRPAPDREQYLAKRAAVLASDAHFVEIDLLRGWERMPAQGMPACDYCVMVSRYEQRPDAGIWPLDLRDRLPVIPIPLRDPDPDARLDLQQVLDRVYDAAYYKDYIYAGAPVPPLAAGDAAWAGQFVPTAP